MTGTLGGAKSNAESMEVRKHDPQLPDYEISYWDTNLQPPEYWDTMRARTLVALASAFAFGSSSAHDAAPASSICGLAFAAPSLGCFGCLRALARAPTAYVTVMAGSRGRMFCTDCDCQTAADEPRDTEPMSETLNSKPDT